MENNQENSSISKNEDKKEDPEKYNVTDNGIFSLKKPRDVRNQPFLFVSFSFHLFLISKRTKEQKNKRTKEQKNKRALTFLV